MNPMRRAIETGIFCASQSLVHGNPHQTGREFCSALKTRETPVCPYVRILHYIFCLGIIPQNRSRHPIESLIVTAHEQLIELGLARQHPRDNLLVAPILSFVLARLGPRWPSAFLPKY